MTTPPADAVSFLFTDIEGSTRLWEQFPEAMRTALARHDTLLRAAIRQNGGQVFKTIGDAFCAVFSDPEDALRAAISAQCALRTETWQDSLEVRVRVALHRGEAEQRDGDYFGQTLNRVARLLASGHGGQTLLSDAMRDSLPHLPAGVSLLDLGTHQFRDLSEPMTVYQLLHPNLPEEFPPLRAQEPEKTNLPAPTDAFIGREREIEDLRRLSTARIITLTGIGGTGKTRLATKVGAERLKDFPDGVWLISLEPISDPSRVAQAVAEVMDIRDNPGQEVAHRLAAALRDRCMLLILDNCEHNLKAVAELADLLLRSCPRLFILATSREPLGIAGERVYPLQPLPEKDAVRLFTDRAALARPNFAVSRNDPTVARLCRRLDGLPLALELAAARVSNLTVQQIEERLDDRFRLLSEDGQSPLRALVDWSYELLDDREKLLLGRLGVFIGGWTLEAAEDVCTDELLDKWAILELLTALAEKSLLITDARPGMVRYRMLETLRQYARERLIESGKEPILRARHANYFLAFAVDIFKDAARRESEEGLNAIERDYDNLRAVMDYFLAAPDGGERGLELTTCLASFWDVRGHYQEGRKRYAAALSHQGATQPTRIRAVCSNVAGNLAYHQGDFEAALCHYQEALSIFHTLHDPSGTATSMNNIGNIYSDQGDFDRAYAYFKEALAIRRRRGEIPMVAGTLVNLGNVRLRQGDIEGALPIYHEAYRLSDLSNFRMGQLFASDCLGYAACLMKDADLAREWYAKALPLCRELGSPQLTANVLLGLAFAARMDRHFSVAARFSGAQEALREEIGAPMETIYKEEYDRHLKTIRIPLGERPFNAVFNAGRTMSREEAWMEALRYALAPEEAAEDTVFGIMS